MKNNILNKSSIVRKTMQVGWATLVSRLFGLIREVLLGKFFGASFLGDVFVTAFKIPNSLRKIFAEGALSAALVPVFVKLHPQDDGKKSVNSLMTASFLVFEGFLILFCIWVFWRADLVMRVIMPGWYTYNLPETQPGLWGMISHVGHFLAMMYNPVAYNMIPGPKIAYTIHYLRILISFIVLISSSALLSGALQSVNHFTIPAISPVVINVIYIAGILVAMSMGVSDKSVEYICYFLLVAGLAQFLLHLWIYFKLGFNFGGLTAKAWERLRFVINKFLACSLSMSIMEINLFLDMSLASYLPSGSIVIIYLANRFMGIPLGVFAVAFSTILLPHFSRVSVQAPKRLSFYLFEATKFVFWVTIPVALFMSYFSDKIFYTLFLSEKFPVERVVEASYVLMAFLLGLFFFSLNKILLSLYYSLHEVRIPTIITLVATFINLGVNLMWLELFKATGLALATTVSGVAQTTLFLFFLHKKYNFELHLDKLLSFMGRYAIQVLCITGAFWAAYRAIYACIEFMPAPIARFFTIKLGVWLWALPLGALAMLILYATRRRFGIKLYFLD